jgi:hypothetical protein
MTTLIYEIPPNLPFPKGGILPLFGKEACDELSRVGIGEIFMNYAP